MATVPGKYHLPRARERSMGLWGLDMAQLVLTLIAAVIAIFMLRSGHVGVLVALGVIWTCVTFIPVFRRPLYEWVPAVIAYTWRIATSGAKRPKAEVKSRERALGVLGSTFEPVHVMLHPGPDGKPLSIARDESGRFTLALTFDAGTFLMKDGPAQDAWLGQWGSLLDELASPGSMLTNLSWYHSTLPPTMALHEAMLRRMGVSDDSPYYDVVSSVGQIGCSHLTTLVLQTSVARSRRGSGAIRWGETGRTAIMDSLVDMYTTTVRYLEEMGARNIRPFGPGEYPVLIRLLVNPYRHDGLFRDLLAGGRDATQIEGIWPDRVEETVGTVTADGILHALFDVENLPTGDLAADALAHMLNVRAPVRTFAWSARPKPSALTSRRHEMHETVSQAMEMERDRIGRVQSASDESQGRHRRSRRAELAEGYTEWQIRMVICVSGRTRKELDANILTVRAQARKCGMSLRRQLFEQLPNFTTALPVAQSVR